MKNHAFIIQAHAYPELLERTLTLLEANNHFFFINLDKKNTGRFTNEWHDRVQKIKNVYFQKPMNVNHSGFSQVGVNLSLLKLAYNFSGVRFDYIHALSGQDFPCVDPYTFDSIFEHNSKSYMHFDSPEEVKIWRKHKYPNRVNKYYLYDINIPVLPLNWAVRLKNNNIVKFLLEKIPRKEIPNLYAGWAFFSWERKVVEYVLTYFKENPAFLKRFKMTSTPDEVIYHTLLFDVADKLEIEKYNSLRFIEWHPKRPAATLPLVLEETEFKEITNANVIFCRKVHPEKSAKLLDLLEDKIRKNTHDKL